MKRKTKPTLKELEVKVRIKGRKVLKKVATTNPYLAYRKAGGKRAWLDILK